MCFSDCFHCHEVQWLFFVSRPLGIPDETGNGQWARNEEASLLGVTNMTEIVRRIHVAQDAGIRNRNFDSADAPDVIVNSPFSRHCSNVRNVLPRNQDRMAAQAGVNRHNDGIRRFARKVLAQGPDDVRRH